MASYFEGGELACFRLAPKDYHRFHSPVDAVVGKIKFIHGEYLVSYGFLPSVGSTLTLCILKTVNPIVVNNSSLDVFTMNKRDGIIPCPRSAS